MSKKSTIVVMGIMGRSPFAGVAWQALHYLEGFRRLGSDVYYFEDTGTWPYDAERNTITNDCSYIVNYIARLMAWWGQADRWAYRSGADHRIFGLSESQNSRLLARADVLINVTGSTWLREEHLRVPIRVYLETDPVLPQIEVAKGYGKTVEHLRNHTHYFSFGENLGGADCPIPIEQFTYRPTRQPIVLEWWTPAASETSNGQQPASPAHRFTTISNWRQTDKDIEWNGETYLWSKHVEFLKFIDLPRRTAQPLELALACSETEALQLLASHGWQIRDAVALSKDILPYRDYVLGSCGEFTVAKDQYVRLRSGWFSDRSACYLAAGRPVITQDTGFGKVLPCGEGLFPFNTIEDILAAFEAISSDYPRHCKAARAIAEEYFRAETVVGQIIDSIGL